MDGNLAPNAGSEWYNEPEEQAAAERDELSKLGDPRMVINSIYEWFAEEAEQCDHVSNIDGSLTGQAYEVEAKALTRLKYLLEAKADEFKGLVDGPAKSI